MHQADQLPTEQGPAPAPDFGPTQALLKRLRARNLSQSEISRRTGISQPKLSRWEAGETSAGADDALRLKALEEELSATDHNTERGAAGR